MASRGLAIGCHPYYPQYITTSDYKYAEQNPYAKPTWPLAWFPMGQISTCKAPLTITGEVSGATISLHFSDTNDANVVWDIDVVVSYHDTLLEMLEEKGIGWCYCELYNPFGKHIVLVTGESQWEGTIVNKVSYPYDNRIDILCVNQQLLDVFRKYTKNN